MKILPTLKSWLLFALLFTLLFTLLCGFASAQTLTGKVTNGTTNKPSAGDEVILIKLGNGMEEAARAKSDASGNFTLKLDDNGPHLVRVIHQGVTYHHMAPPGSTTAEVEVFDVVKKLDAISVTADVRRFQAKDNQLEGIILFAVNNTSQPPRTQMNDQNFEFYLPDGAHVDQSMAMTSGGQPVNTEPVPQKEKNRYAFNFPLRPGETQFQVVYELPYTGKLEVQPRLMYGTQHFVVMLPKTMTFSAADRAAFKSMDDPRQSDAIVQVVTNASPNQPLGFTIGGVGVLEDAKDDSAGTPAPAPNSSTVSAADRPGGGLGPPIDAPDPLEKYRWFILGGFGVVLTAGAVLLIGRSKTALPDAVADDDLAEIAAPVRPVSAGRPGLLLEALKEEMFQLELDRKQGKLSQEEYEKAKAALDQTLDRALKRNS
ncbi:MAG: carboxypeptidase regulatory-like domain-containing protein [Terriglobales bacterium]|jgi:hypothetical protein